MLNLTFSQLDPELTSTVDEPVPPRHYAQPDGVVNGTIGTQSNSTASGPFDLRKQR
ncbi:hypothetical protein [Bradyrhizobium sp. B117]|uniref:hypothetical protein n=1 Tax=Bradyrhizobium sp. B117 TaxID=3140246 RepID=UPI003183488C